MKTLVAIGLGLLMAGQVSAVLAETLVPVRTLRPGTVIGQADLSMRDEATPGAVSTYEQIVGLEARTVLYAGRPVFPASLGSPALVERNQLVTLVFKAGSVNISTEGRSLERGAEGDLLRVMNLSSRNTVIGRVAKNGTIRVSQ